MKSEPKEYAKVAWRAGDLEEFRPQWTDSQRQEWLANHARILQDVMIERGFSAIEDLLAEEE